MKSTRLFSICTLALILFAGSNANGQITLTAATHTPSFGESFNYFTISGASVDLGTGGAAQTWDFSGLSGGTPSTVIFGDPLDGVDNSNHAGANLAAFSALDYEEYYVASSDGLAIKGRYVPSVIRESFTDVREFVKFPITYGDTHNETFDGISENLAITFVTERGGTSEISADAYGDLILPYGTLTNVLRVRLVENYSDKMGGITLFNYTDTIYLWFHASTSAFVATTTKVYVDGTFGASTSTYIAEGFVSTAIDYAAQPVVEIYPNPATAFVNVRGLADDLSTLEIFNAAGEIVYQSQLNPGANVQIDISDFAAGLYFVNLNTGKGILTERLLVE